MSSGFKSISLAALAAVLAASAAFADEQPIKVGVVTPLSGSLVAYGKSTLDGVKLRVDQINAAGGINGRKIELIVEDNKGAPAETRNAFIKLASSDKAVCVIGPITSTNALAIRRDAQELKVPVISPTATNDKVTQRNPYMFRACFNDSFQGRIIANYAFKVKGVKKAATLTDMNSDYSKGLSKSFKEAFISLGGKIVAEEGYQQKETEFGPQLKKIAASVAETLFVPGYPPELPLIIKQAKVVGLEARLCGAEGWDNEPVVNGSGENVEGCFIVGAFSSEDSRPVVKNFIADFTKAYGTKPGSFQALGADSVTLLAEALKKGGATPEGVKNALHSLKDVELVTGKTSMGPDGDVEKSAVILEIKRDGDRFTTKYLTTVAP